MKNEVIANLTVEEKSCICSIISKSKQSVDETYVNYDTKIAKSTFMWNEINTRVKELEQYGWELYTTRQGPWPFIIMYKNGYLYTFIRNKKFKDVLKKKSEPHYSLTFAHFLNKDIESTVKTIYSEQTELFSEQTEWFFEQKITMNGETKNKFHEMLDNLVRDDKSIRNHAFIVFDTDDLVILSIEIMVLDSQLNVADYENWNDYIKVETSYTTEVADPKDVYEPTKGVKLSKQALAVQAEKEQRLKEEPYVVKSEDR